jgi:glutathione peroxidase
MALDQYRGQPLLLVNTNAASRFAPQLIKLQELWNNYRHFGLVVIGLPCDDFGAEEGLDDEELADFYRSRFGVRFPLTRRQHLSGQST